MHTVPLFYQREEREEGGEREHIPQGLHGLYSFPNLAYLTRKRRERDRERKGKRETTQAVTEKLQ